MRALNAFLNYVEIVTRALLQLLFAVNVPRLAEATLRDWM
jgi:hypothetical protein